MAENAETGYGALEYIWNAGYSLCLLLYTGKGNLCVNFLLRFFQKQRHGPVSNVLLLQIWFQIDV